jgi:flagellar operon protein
VDRAAAKGAGSSLVLMDGLALIVSVPKRVVITAVDEAGAKEGVFTNIDSAVIARSGE